jgi:hypothetical protein
MMGDMQTTYASPFHLRAGDKVLETDGSVLEVINVGQVFDVITCGLHAKIELRDQNGETITENVPGNAKVKKVIPE